jgi:transposase
MPKIIRVRLTAEQRDELNRRARARTQAPRLRERLEMVRLSDLGQSIPQIARTLDLHEQTVRKYLKAFLADGFAALPDRPIPGRPPTMRPADLEAVGQVLDVAAARGETWTTPRLRHWLATERGVRISTGRLGVLLRRERLRWKRTQHSVRHLQKDPALQDAAQAALESLIL